MYRLLIVSKAAQIEAIFTSIESWEAMGYKQPRIRQSVDAAIECMHKHHIDAIAIDDDPEFKPLYAYLDQNAPDMPIFQLGKDVSEQKEIIRQLDQLLGYLHSDHSDDDYDESYYMNLARANFMHRLLCGRIETSEELLSQHKLLRMNEKTDEACVYITLSVPQGDQFLSGRWHYGSERLEMALRNFFGKEYAHMSVCLSVVSPEEVRVLFCPVNGAVATAQDQDVRDYIKDTIQSIEHYLGLSMALESIDKVGGLYAFTTQNGFTKA